MDDLILGSLWIGKCHGLCHHQTLFRKAKFSSLEQRVRVRTSVNPTSATSRRNRSVSLLIGLGEAMQKERGTVCGMMIEAVCNGNILHDITCMKDIRSDGGNIDTNRLVINWNGLKCHLCQQSGNLL